MIALVLGILSGLSAPVFGNASEADLESLQGGVAAEAAIPDGSGGMIAVFRTRRTGGAFYDLYVRRISSSGEPLWTTTGVLCTSADGTRSPVLASDGAAGVILAWVDQRGPSTAAIYAQRVDASGTVMWTPGGVALCSTPNPPPDGYVDVASDGAGGAIIAWWDNRNDGGDIYAQRVNASGTAVWAPGGVAVAAFSGTQSRPKVVSDGAGGVIVNWGDTRNGNADYYAQRVNANGVAQWTPGGVPVCTATGIQQMAGVAPDGAQGAFIVWRDWRSGTADIWIQRIDANGVALWAPNGVPVCAAAGDQTRPAVISDGFGGAFVAWHDCRNGTDWHVYVQLMSPGGWTRWQDGVALNGLEGAGEAPPALAPDMVAGVIVASTLEVYPGVKLVVAQDVIIGTPVWRKEACSDFTGFYFQTEPVIASDGAAGVILAWVDERTGAREMYAQRLDLSGDRLWGNAGVELHHDPGRQREAVGVGDGMGGTILAWMEMTDEGYRVYAQRVDPSGLPVWSKTPASTLPGSQVLPSIVADGAGGAILAWTSSTSGENHAFVQRLSSTGNRLWGDSGVEVAHLGGEESPDVTPDGGGGAIVCWQGWEDASSTSWDIYAMHISADGQPTWVVSVCTASNDQSFGDHGGAAGARFILRDGTGGAYIAWQDKRNGADWDIYAQRIDANGLVQWGANGVGICTASGDQQNVVIVRRTPDGFTAVWEDQRAGNTDIYAQSMSRDGIAQWAANGVPVEGGAWNAYGPRVAMDAAGGAIVAWYDYRAAGANIYAQRLAAAGGGALWAPNGVVACTASGDRWRPTIAADGEGGAVIAWEDHRAGSGGNDLVDVYAQRIGDDGSLRWAPDGVAVCDATNTQARPVLVSLSLAGTVVAWQDRRDGHSDWIYAQSLTPSGTPIWPDGPVTSVPVLPVPTSLSIQRVWPNPGRGDLQVALALPGTAETTLELLDVTGRRVLSRVVESAGAGLQVVTLRPDCSLRSGVYFLRVIHAGESVTARTCVLK